MNFQLTEEHLVVQQAARDFAQSELLPGVIERDTHQKFPEAQIRKMAEQAGKPYQTYIHDILEKLTKKGA